MTNEEGEWIYKQSFYSITRAFLWAFLRETNRGKNSIIFFTLSFFSVSPRTSKVNPLYKLSQQMLLLFQACLLCAYACIETEKCEYLWMILGWFEYWEKNNTFFLFLIYYKGFQRFIVWTVKWIVLSFLLSRRSVDYAHDSWKLHGHSRIISGWIKVEFKLWNEVKIKSRWQESWTTSSQFNFKYGNRKLVRTRMLWTWTRCEKCSTQLSCTL